MNSKFSTFFLFLILFSLTSKAQKKENHFHIGGALRFNIFDKSWVNDHTQPEFTWDTWRLNVDGTAAGIDLSFEYRFYPNSNIHFIHHGYFGYAWTKDLYMKLGVLQVPFGIQGFASHSYFFQGQYYFGLEDDYDIGINFYFKGIKNLELDLAYFREAEPQGSGGYASRYSYDIVPGQWIAGTDTTTATIKELNQLNLRAVYSITPNIRFGVSGQVGGIYNSNLNRSETSTALAAHIHSEWGSGWSVKATALTYNYSARSDDNIKLDIVQMGAYGASYDVAAKARSYSAGLAKTFPVNWGPVGSIEAHLDYAYIRKHKNEFKDSQQIVPGLLIDANPIFIYIDYAMGKNHPWFNAIFGEGLGKGAPNAKWMKRFNINIGYYF